MSEQTFLPARNSSVERTLVTLAAAFTGLGLVAGVAMRELTRHASGDPGQLGLVHGHLLSLGTLVMLVLLVLQRVYGLSAHRTFTWGLWTYTVGVMFVAVMQFVNGMRSLSGLERTGMIAGISGLGHIILTIGFVLLFVTLFRSVGRKGAA